MDLQKEREAWLFNYYPKAKELGIVYRPDDAVNAVRGGK